MSSAKALFVNDGASGDTVWVTDATAVGTTQLPLIIDPGTHNIGLIKGPTTSFYSYKNKIMYVDEEFTISFPVMDKLKFYVTDGSVAGTTTFSVTTDANNIGLSLAAGLAGQVGNKFLIYDQSTSEVGLPPTVEFLVTDGTDSGTTTFTVAGPPYPLPFNPGPFFSFGNLVLFSATDYSGNDSLWVSNGTSAGTKPLAVKGAGTGTFPSGGLSPRDFTAFGDKVLFSGIDINRYAGLWITDGTAAGTYELTKNTSAGNITVVDGKAFFVDGSGFFGDLWVTDGTAAGTTELKAVGGTLTAFGNKVLDAGGPEIADLFVSDGTASGTQALKWTGEVAERFVALGNKVLFEAEDTADHLGLWVTDGTSAGTFEITEPNEYIFGFFNEVNFDGAVVGNEVVFSATDKLGETGLWVTDGTVAGTKEIRAPLSVADLVSIPPPPSPSGLKLASASDSGVKGDGLTNVTIPTITGKGVAGDKVTLRDGGKTIGTAKVAAGGTWSVTPASALAAGVHTLTATESGATGTSAASAALKLTIKTSAAIPSALGFAVGTDKGTAGDVVTVSGTGEAGDRVTVFDGAKALRGTTVGGGGAWTVALNPLAVGAHSLSAGEVDVAGNTSARSPAQRLTIAHAGPNAVTFFGSAGTDRFTGGAGADVFRFSAADLAATDIVKGGGGNDELRLTSAGTIRANGVGGVETYVLFNGAGNVLTLADGQFRRGHRQHDHGRWRQCRQHAERSRGVGGGQGGAEGRGRGRHTGRRAQRRCSRAAPARMCSN